MTNNTFKVDGVFYTGSTTFSMNISSEYFDTEEEAMAVFTALAFPKYAKVAVGPIYGSGEGVKFFISGHAVFASRTDNEKNETGERRIRAMAKALKGTPQVRPAINWQTPMTAEEINTFGFEL